MQVPLELHIDDSLKSSRTESLVRRRVDKLERFCDHIQSCRVAVERPSKHVSSGSGFRVRIEMRVPPQHELVAREEPGDGEVTDTLEQVIHRAFSAAERQLKELVDRQQGEVKTHEVQNAFVVRLFKEDDYGFLKTPQEREIYFHKNSVAGDDFERLEVGTQVRFEEAMGEMGPQATTVQIIDKPGTRSTEEEPETAEPPKAWQN